MPEGFPLGVGEGGYKASDLSLTIRYSNPLKLKQQKFLSILRSVEFPLDSNPLTVLILSKGDR